MRLRSVYISNYKNLKNFEVKFDGGTFIDVFVGKNGTGKSNFFEALIEIFRHLYEIDKGKKLISFDYTIKYEINGNLIEISWEQEKLLINNKKRKIGNTDLPDNILIYYSGHNDKVYNLIKDYEDSFKGLIQTADIQDTRKFIGIGKEYKQLLLAMLLMQNEDNSARKFICKKLGIRIVDSVVKVILKRPFYAKTHEYDIENNDETDRFWKPMGITKDFLSRLLKCKADDSKGPVRTEGYFKNEDTYIYYFDIRAILKEFRDYSSQELFRQFDNLKTLEMLREISSKIILENGEEATTSFFSDGQFQLVYIYSIIELFKDRNCVTLLDEPDCFLHPEWQHEFFKQVFEITNTTVKNNHVLVSSHSAVTLIKHEKEKIKFFDIQGNSAKCYDLIKRVAIDKLSAQFVHYSEKEQILSIINAIQIKKKPVLFTEGITDPIILKEAWYNLYEDAMPFIPFYAFNCTYLDQLLKDDKIVSEMSGLPLFGLFDFDEAYNLWNGMDRTKWDEVEKDPDRGLIKKQKDKEVYAIMLPVPKDPIIRKQVIKDEATKETFGGNSHCEIEHVFYGSQKTKEYFQEELLCGRVKTIAFKSDSVKKKFAQEVIPTVEREYFEVFRPMFEFIRSKSKCLSFNYLVAPTKE